MLFASLFSVGSNTALFAEFSFPTPTGKYAVGTQSLCLIDESRVDTTLAGKTGPRRLMVQLWYPTDEKTPEKLPSYFPKYLADSWKTDFGRIPGVSKEDLLEFDNVTCHSLFPAKISSANEQYPLIVFVHGHGCCRFYYTAIIEELASHGFVVACADHTLDCCMTQYPDGTIVKFAPSYDPETLPDEEWHLVDTQLEKWEQDVEFTIHSLVTSEKYIDAERIATIGHSFGGAVAIQTALRDQCTIKAVALMDPAPCGNPIPTSLNIPFFWFTAEETHFDEFIENTKISDAKKEILRRNLRAYQTQSVYSLVFSANHMISSDFAILKHMNIFKKAPHESQDLGTGSLDGFTATKTLREHLVAFFNTYLLEKTSPGVAVE